MLAEYRTEISELKQSNAHFTNIFEKHNFYEKFTLKVIKTVHSHKKNLLIVQDLKH